MRTTPDHFNRSDLTILRGSLETGERVPVRRYTYESAAKLYDVDVYPTGARRYAVNTRDSAKGPYHAAIEAHFGLEA